MFSDKTCEDNELTTNDRLHALITRWLYTTYLLALWAHVYPWIESLCYHINVTTQMIKYYIRNLNYHVYRNGFDGHIMVSIHLQVSGIRVWILLLSYIFITFFHSYCHSFRTIDYTDIIFYDVTFSLIFWFLT